MSEATDLCTAATPLVRLRAECVRAKIPSVEWCASEAQLTTMLRSAKSWQRMAVGELIRHCKVGRIPCDGIADREALASRLRQVMVWNAMENDQLRVDCTGRGIAYPVSSGTRFSALVADDKKDLLARLMQHAFGLLPGAQAPIPVAPAPGGVRAGAPMGPGAGRAKASVAGPEKAKKKAPEPTEKPPTPRSEDDEEARESRRRSAGPRIAKLLLEFPFFGGELPGEVAEKYWTDGELHVYFGSGGYIKPVRRSPAPPTWKPKAPESVLARHYRALGLEPKASTEAVRNAFKRLALQHHPDKNPENQDAAEFRKVTEAYEAICGALGA